MLHPADLCDEWFIHCAVELANMVCAL